ncbi:monovalent cation/H(+) antiporter subunit G [Gracilibacillus caseinilyticus]|uniref:Monovalent cation/H(+) antiporter subunit G n=1 Tax=Gracilibacillus caseinilyticus TaxID=2932256 RepID=A0ABY4ESX0_9BACI|nr:monovalent cation/H(+) antiporter subunit G [Gracilibacillus caseinilyticus]UOQ47359.1 monovalent cation/H(+) antiporter subunit G [Gracilibacillus caseinilyticus]
MTGTTTEFIMNILVIVFLIAGTFFVISASIGVIRFPDIYTRLHASTKAATLGISGIMIGAFIFLYVEHQIVSGKLILGIIFILLTAPVSAHMIGRAAHSIGIKPWSQDGNTKDEYADALKDK